MYHFELHHVAGKTFGADGLSRREGQPGDEEYAHPEEVDDEINGPPKYVKVNEDDPDPLEFENFKDEIDTRGGYVQTTYLEQVEPIREARTVACFQQELNRARKEMLAEQQMVQSFIQEGNVLGEQQRFLEQFILGQVIPDDELAEEAPDDIEYDERNRTEAGIEMDKKLPMIKLG